MKHLPADVPNTRDCTYSCQRSGEAPGPRPVDVASPPHIYIRKAAETNIQAWLMEKFLEGRLYPHVLKETLFYRLAKEDRRM